MVLHHCLRKFLGVVSYSAECEGCAVLDGDGGVEEEGAELFEDVEGVEVVDVLGFRCEVSDLLSEFNF